MYFRLELPVGLPENNLFSGNKNSQTISEQKHAPHNTAIFRIIENIQIQAL